MFRDFSESAKRKLLSYVDEVTETSFWGKVGDAIGDAGHTVSYWLGFLNVSNYMDKMDEYHKKILDKNNTTKTKVNEIFAEVKSLDNRYGTGMSNEVSIANNVVTLINDLASTIDPNGGNLDMEKMSAILAADLEEIRKSQETKEQAVEENMLGTDPDAAVMSADPVNLSTGNFVYDHKDLEIGGEIALSFHRYYNSKDFQKGALGKCFRHNYEISIEVSDDENVKLRLADGQVCHFAKVPEGIYVAKDHVLGELTKKHDNYVLNKRGNEILVFNKEGKIIRQENRNGRGINFVYNEKKQLTEAVSDNGSSLKYYYDTNNNFLKTVEDHTGRKIEITYQKELLESVTLATGTEYIYEYGINGRISSVINSQKVAGVKNTYDTKFRVVQQQFPDGGVSEFKYDDDTRRVTLIERNGSKTVYVHDEKYRNVETIYEDGTKERYLYNDNNQCISMTDRNGNTRRRAYDDRGNITQIVDAKKRRINMTYDADNHLINVSINGKERIKNYYDSKGNFIGSENVCGENVRIEYDENGRAVALTQPNGSRSELVYDEQGNIAEFKNAGEITKCQYDALNRVIKTQDANGNFTEYAYDEADHIISIKNAAGNIREYKYNSAGRISELKDFDGYKMNLTYNCVGKVDSFTDKEGNVFKYAYDKMWNIKSQINPDQGEKKYIYDKDNHLIEEILPMGEKVIYSYDAVGNRTGITDPEGNTTLFVYDEENNLIEMTTADGEKTCYTYDREGNMIAGTDALGNVIRYEYDLLNRKISETDPKGNKTRFTYDSTGNVACISHPNGSETIYEYEYDGKIKSVRYPDGKEEYYTYDKNRNQISQTNAAGEITYMKYDELNRMIETVNPAGGKRLYLYNEIDKVTEVQDENGNKTFYEYSPNGNLTKVTDALGNVSIYEYDCMGRLTKTVNAGNNGEAERQKTYIWNLNGQLKSVLNNSEEVENYTYNGNGKIISKVDADGYCIKFTYTATGDVKEIVYADGRKVSLSYDPLRRIEEMKDWIGTTRFTMNELGQVVSVTDPYGDTIGYEWGNMGEKTAIVYPDGKRMEYEYNRLMQLVSLHTPQNEIRYTYDQFGRLKEKAMPGKAATKYAYNSSGAIEEIFYEADNFHERYHFTYDLSGKKIATEKERFGIEENERLSFAYDSIGRLESVEKNEKLLRKYIYDAFGNRIRKEDYTEKDINQINYVYNAKNQLIEERDNQTIKNYEYDRRGNLISVKCENNILKQFTFDVANHMSSSMGVVNGIKKYAEYRYNGMGQRTEQNVYGNDAMHENTESKLQYTVDPLRPYHNLLQSKNSETGERQTFYWDGNIVAMEDRDSEIYYLQDELGSVMHLLDKNGIKKESYLYDEFGIELHSVEEEKSEVLQPFRYTGYQKDEVGDLYFAQARRYDPVLGRFISEDFESGDISETFTLNPYVYCWNQPLDLLDLDGRWPTLPSNISIISDTFDVAYEIIEAIVRGDFKIPDFENLKEPGKIKVNDTAFYKKGRGTRIYNESTLKNGKSALSNKYKIHKGLKFGEKVLFVISGVLTFFEEWIEGKNLSTDDRISNALIETAVSLALSTLGSWAGGKIGALIGGALGTSLGPVGTIIGTIVGAIVGVIISNLMKYILEPLIEWFKNIINNLRDGVEEYVEGVVERMIGKEPSVLCANLA